MAKPQENRRYLLWLALGTACMAMVMAGLLALQLTQGRAIRASVQLQGDNITALTFQLEREFMRTRAALETAVNHPDDTSTEALTLRFDILMSRVELLRDNPSVEALKLRPEYLATLPRLEALHDQISKVVNGKGVDTRTAGQLITELESLGPEVQALSIASTSIISEQLEDQVAKLHDQNDKIVWLTLAQLILLLVAAVALTVRQRRQEEERKALETLTEELREANLQAEQANRSKSQFLANMSHELRTPFNGMLGMLALLETSRLDADQADYLSTARQSATHLLDLLNDILDISKLESGRLDIVPHAQDLQRLLRDVQSLMAMSAEAKGLRLQVVVADSVPQWVLADGKRVKQILFNLMSNAVKFTAQGEVSLVVTALAVADDDSEGMAHELSFVVRDTGIGMDPAMRERLFQRFMQGDASTSRRSSSANTVHVQPSCRLMPACT